MLAQFLPRVSRMARPLRDFFAGMGLRRQPYEAIEPRWTFDRVVLPESTRRALSEALAQIHQHDLIFRRWGLGEKHTSGLGLAFNFAGPPGTGKTICAEAIAHELGQPLLVVRYAEAESMWAGETAKNVRAMFEAAREQEAVLFFDEADAIAMRRSVGSNLPQDRESNLIVNVLLRELEAFNGIAIFATNLAANFDRAFERRIRTHVLFEMPGAEERARIWQLQIHPNKTPLAADVDFRQLAERYVMSGGDIKNAVIKGAAAAAAEPGADHSKRIFHRHFESAAQDVLAAKTIMRQSLFADAEITVASPVSMGQTMEARSRTAIRVALALAGSAFIAALVALALVLLR